ncbi:hypothetical protein MAR_027846 [Mya arenaria]|uniref:Transposase n=1 Tax=Mya arenaria TaxID=6604 RepID=A0ABY7EXW8_MYAAR|nr:hypothetical protein MAR_027846 [Mya arenaria]
MDKSSPTTSTPIAPVGNKRDLSPIPSDEYLAAESKKARPDDPIELLSDEIDSLKTENAHLKARISVLEKSEDRLKHLEQYSRRNSLRISGVCEREGESTNDIVTKLVSDLGSIVSLDEIDRSHRVGRPRRNDPAKPRDIIVKFTSFRARQKLYSVRSQAKHCQNLKKVFVNEDLCKARSDVFYLAQSLVRNGNINSAWTSDGVILIRDNDMHLHRVTKARELDNFQSVTVPRTSPTSQRWVDQKDVKDLKANCIIECDLEYPKEIHNLHSDYPLAPEKMVMFNDDLFAINKIKQQLVANRPCYVGMSILELSKYLMYDFHYNYILKKYGKENTLTLFVMKYKQKMHMRIYMLINTFLITVITQVVEEAAGTPITEFVRLRSKMYSFTLNDKCVGHAFKKCKGITKEVVKRNWYLKTAKKHSSKHYQ